MTQVELIRQKIETLPLGQPFGAAIFSQVAERSSIDKTLARLAKAGLIAKVTRGIYVRPKMSRFGIAPPEISKLAALKTRGQPITVHGAEALRQLGLSTQVPVKPVYCTTARTKSFMVGKTEVRLQHVSPRKMAHVGTNVGTALSALWYLGKKGVNHTVFQTIKSKLSSEEYSTLKAAAAEMPGWMARSFREFENGKSRA
jgi:hypothetical protein